MNLYIMRHGETDWNKQGLLQGSADIPLNEYGITLAKKTGDGFKKDGIHFDKIYASPYIRAKETARIIAADTGLAVNVDNRIREMGFGSYEGIKICELKTNPDYAGINKCFADPVNYIREGNAESYEELFARIRSFLEEIRRLEGFCENVLVVCHGAVIRAFISIIKGMHLSQYWTIHQPNCCVNIAQVSSGNIVMVEENRLYYEKKTEPERGFV